MINSPAVQQGSTFVPKIDEHQLESLVSKAWESRMYAYAPYSQFRVGAAALAADGRIFTGANVENASYGLSMCAERVAINAAAAAGVRSFAAIAVAGEGDHGIVPCGACRQVLAEFSQHALVLRCLPDGSHSTTPLSDLLPEAFTGMMLAEGDPRNKLDFASVP